MNRDELVAARIEALNACIWIGAHLGEVRVAADRDWDEGILVVSEGAAVNWEPARQAMRAAFDLDANALSWLADDTARALRAIDDLRAWAEQPDDALHPAVVRAVSPVLRDLAHTGGPRLRVEHRPQSGFGEDLTLTVWAPSGSGTSVWVDQFGDDEENVGLVADAIQQLVVETEWTGWPSCPRHPNSHPLRVTEDGHWACTSGTPVARIGELGSPETRGPTSG